MARLDFALEAGGDVVARNSCDIALYSRRDTSALNVSPLLDADTVN